MDITNNYTIRKENNRYNIYHKGILFAEISDGRKYGMYNVYGNHWKIEYMDGRKPEHYKTLRQAKHQFNL